MARFDVIVIGAGHNGLVCAAYLERPAYASWSWSARLSPEAPVSARNWCPDSAFLGSRIQRMVRVRRICSDLGIPAGTFEVATPDPVLVQVFPDGQRIAIWRDPKRTQEEIDRWSAGDGRSSRLSGVLRQGSEDLWGRFSLEDSPERHALEQKYTGSQDRRVSRFSAG